VGARDGEYICRGVIPGKVRVGMGLEGSPPWPTLAHSLTPEQWDQRLLGNTTSGIGAKGSGLYSHPPCSRAVPWDSPFPGYPSGSQTLSALYGSQRGVSAQIKCYIMILFSRDFCFHRH
jgi:hypothetical protein